MNDPISTLKTSLAHWSRKGVEGGWFAASEAPQVPERDQQSPSNLFEMSDRPLVVAFFGGTGVGKSSLLNRLAGEAVARSSAERPTSREITFYLHESVTLSRLPAELPTDRIKQAMHRNDKYKNVLWVDMPDFDSVESANRNLVNDWLPHIDLLAYVVNPERYRDDSGWRMLMANASRHAWVFIINHWDRGATEQRDAFQGMLTEAGLSDPLIFCTDCSEDPSKPNGDQFDAFETTIRDMAKEQFVKQLEEHGVLVRIADAKEHLQQATTRLSQLQSAIEQSARSHAEFWPSHQSDTLTSLGWKFKQLALPYREFDRGFMGVMIDTLLRRPRVNSSTLPKPDVNELVDETFLNSMRVGIDRARHDAVAAGVPDAVARRTFQPLFASVEAMATRTIKSASESALLEPGTSLQRHATRVLKILSWLLPLAVLVWALFRLIASYQSGKQYLGFDFATHTLLLAGAAWLIPWIIGRMVKPTLENAVQTGLHNGTEQVHHNLQQQIQSAFQQLENERRELAQSAAEPMQVLPHNVLRAVERNTNAENQIPDLSRVLVTQAPAR